MLESAGHYVLEEHEDVKEFLNGKTYVSIIFSQVAFTLNRILSENHYLEGKKNSNILVICYISCLSARKIIICVIYMYILFSGGQQICQHKLNTSANNIILK